MPKGVGKGKHPSALAKQGIPELSDSLVWTGVCVWVYAFDQLTNEYMNTIDLTDSSPQPVVMTPEAIREVARAKIQNLFASVHIPQKALHDIQYNTIQYNYSLKNGSGCQEEAGSEHSLYSGRYSSEP